MAFHLVRLFAHGLVFRLLIGLWSAFEAGQSVVTGVAWSVSSLQRLCSRSELSMSIHERVSARLESKRRLRVARRFSFVERQRRARERHQEYLRTRRFTARKFIDRYASLPTLGCSGVCTPCTLVRGVDMSG